jgi:multiple sugar transport system substrate-binding protein
MPYFNWGWNFVVSKKSKESELAYLFCLFACSPKMSILSVRDQSGYFDPFRKEHFNDSKITDVYSGDFLKVHLMSLKKSIPDFYIQGRGRYMSALKRAIQIANDGFMPVDKALDSAAERWVKITHTIGETDQVRQWKFLKKSYPEDLKKVLV